MGMLVHKYVCVYIGMYVVYFCVSHVCAYGCVCMHTHAGECVYVIE